MNTQNTTVQLAAQPAEDFSTPRPETNTNPAADTCAAMHSAEIPQPGNDRADEQSDALSKPLEAPAGETEATTKTPAPATSEAQIVGEVTTIMVRLDRIRIDGSIQPRAEIRAETITEYAEAMRRNAPFPGIALFDDGVHLWLADGFLRSAAAVEAGLVEILAEIRMGTREDALKHALAANDAHGLRRTNQDKRRAVEIGLSEFAEYADRAIADLCLVSHTHVARVRRELEAAASSSKESTTSGSPNQSPVTRRKGRDGKTRKVPKRIPKPKTSPPPDAPNDTTKPPESDEAAANDSGGESTAGDKLGDSPASLKSVPQFRTVVGKNHDFVAVNLWDTPPGKESLQKVGLIAGENCCLVVRVQCDRIGVILQNFKGIFSLQSVGFIRPSPSATPDSPTETVFLFFRGHHSVRKKFHAMSIPVDQKSWSEVTFEHVCALLGDDAPKNPLRLQPEMLPTLK